MCVCSQVNKAIISKYLWERDIPTFLRNEVEERKAKGIKARCHDEPLFDAEKSQTALKYLQYQERKKKNQPTKVSYTKNAFQKYIFFKKQMYGQMSLKTLQFHFTLNIFEHLVVLTYIN